MSQDPEDREAEDAAEAAAPAGEEEWWSPDPATAADPVVLARASDPEPDADADPEPQEVAVALRPDESVFPGLFDLAAQTRAYETYMGGDMETDLATVAEAAKVPLNTVLRWAHCGKWVDKKDDLIRVRARDESQQIALYRISSRKEEIKKQVEVGQRLREKVKKTLDENGELSPGNLKMLGDAAKAAGDLTVRALGVGESGTTAEAAEEREEKAGKRPLVIVFPGGGLPPARAARPANVIEIKPR